MTKKQAILNTPQNILVIRNDKLGDFMLAWPALALLKKQYPNCNLTVLVPEYTKPIAEQCAWIDNIIIDKRNESLFADMTYLVPLLKSKQFDISISLYSEFRTALALWLAKIPVRVAPATKIAQFLYTNTLKQRRSRSEKPEYEYNIDLVKYVVQKNGATPVAQQKAPFLEFDKELIKKIKDTYYNSHNINSNAKLVIIHPGSGGSAINLSLNQYAELAEIISQQQAIHIVITAGPNELEVASSLASLVSATSHSIYHSTQGLVEFSRFIAISDIFISGSTGPLHMAGALNVATAAFYPARRSATSLRWQTLNDEKQRIAFMANRHSGNHDMLAFDLNVCAQKIVGLLQATNTRSID